MTSDILSSTNLPVEMIITLGTNRKKVDFNGKKFGGKIKTRWQKKKMMKRNWTAKTRSKGCSGRSTVKTSVEDEDIATASAGSQPIHTGSEN